jgi:hypothetical protein
MSDDAQALTTPAVSTPAPTSPVAAMPEGYIQPDLDDHFDANEDYQSGVESATTSITSSIFEYQYENGRRYHAYKAGTYSIPNDEIEQERFVGADLSTASLLGLALSSCVGWTSCITSTTCFSVESFISLRWRRTRYNGYSTSAQELESGPLKWQNNSPKLRSLELICLLSNPAGK